MTVGATRTEVVGRNLFTYVCDEQGRERLVNVERNIPQPEPAEALAAAFIETTESAIRAVSVEDERVDGHPHALQEDDIPITCNSAFAQEVKDISIAEHEYTINFESSNIIWRIIKKVFAFFCWPYWKVHSLMGRLVVPGSDCTSASPYRSNGFYSKKLTLHMDGKDIRARILINRNAQKDRWCIYSTGNESSYQKDLADGDDRIFSELESHAILFNYPGTVETKGVIARNRYTIVKAYKAILQLLEDQENGLGAKGIIGYGWSFGGGVQAEAIQSHTFQQDIKYGFITNSSFSSVFSLIIGVASEILGRIGGYIAGSIVGGVVHVCGWNMRTKASSKRLQKNNISEVVFHSKDDGLISYNIAGLVRKLPDAPTRAKFDLPEGHKHGQRLPESYLNAMIEHMGEQGWFF